MIRRIVYVLISIVIQIIAKYVFDFIVCDILNDSKLKTMRKLINVLNIDRFDDVKSEFSFSSSYWKKFRWFERFFCTRVNVDLFIRNVDAILSFDIAWWLVWNKLCFALWLTWQKNTLMIARIVNMWNVKKKIKIKIKTSKIF